MPREQEHSSIPLQVSGLNKRFGPHHVLREIRAAFVDAEQEAA